MIISKKAIPRRTVLRGVGSVLALPLLDSMMPALSAVTWISLALVVLALIAVHVAIGKQLMQVAEGRVSGV